MLIVEERPALRALYVALARHVQLPVEGFLEAPCLADAWRILRVRPPAAAILDVEGPGGEATELVRALRAADPNALVVLATERPWNDPRVLAAISAGAGGYLRKPVHVSDFRHAFAAWRPAAPAEARVASR